MVPRKKQAGRRMVTSRANVRGYLSLPLLRPYPRLGHKLLEIKVLLFRQLEKGYVQAQLKTTVARGYSIYIGLNHVRYIVGGQKK